MPSVAFAFGSFGDIVALIQIIADLVGTLRTGKASAEYEELIAELRALQPVLEHIREEASARDILGATTIDRSSWNAIELAVKKCHSLINDFSDLTQGYGKSLFAGEPGSNIWDFWRNVEWRIFKKGAVAELKEQLMKEKVVMTMMLSLSTSATLKRMERQLIHIAEARAAPEEFQRITPPIPQLQDTTQSSWQSVGPPGPRSKKKKREEPTTAPPSLHPSLARKRRSRSHSPASTASTEPIDIEPSPPSPPFYPEFYTKFYPTHRQGFRKRRSRSNSSASTASIEPIVIENPEFYPTHRQLSRKRRP